MIQKLGKYQITEKLGEGSMGAVYKAYDEVLDRYVAIKTMASDIRWNPELKTRFYREARSAAGLHHPNIVIIHDLGEENKTTFIVMELLTGRDLKAIIREKAPLTLQQKLAIMAQVGDGLNHAHNHQIIHRDIKPGNIYVSFDLNVKILDFGIAHIPSSELTRAGARLGTPFYMSPEQIRGADCDERADIFSAGIVLYELLAFVHPFFAKDMVKTMENIVFQAPLPFEEQLPGAPPGLLPILNGCLEKEPGKRFRRIGEVAQKCRQLIDELNAASRKMCGELEALMPGLQRVIDQRQASAVQAQMHQEAKSLLAQEVTPDYIALQNLLSRIPRELQPQIDISSGSKPAAPPPPPPPPPPRPSVSTPPSTPSDAAEKTQILRSFAEIAKLETPPPSTVPIQSTAAPAPAPLIAKASPASIEIPPKPADDMLQAQDASESGKPLLKEDRKDVPDVDSTAQAKRDEIEQKRKEQIQDLCRRSVESLERKDYDEAASLAKGAIGIDPNCTQALDIMRRIDSVKEENRKSREAFGLAAKAQVAQARQDFDKAKSLLEDALKILPLDPRLTALLDQLKKAQIDAQIPKTAPAAIVPESGSVSPSEVKPIGLQARKDLESGEKTIPPRSIPGRVQEAPQTPEALPRKDFDIGLPAAGSPADRLKAIGLEAGEEASGLDTKPSRRRIRMAIGIAAAAVLLIIACVTVYLMRSRQPRPVDLTQQINQAKSSLSLSQYDQAISLSEQILAASPGNPEASEILKQARERKKQINIDALMLEAQNFRAQNLPEDAIKVLRKILEIEPAHNPALGVLAQIEADISATKSKEEQDKSIKDWAGKAAKLLSAGKINEANAEINKIARLRPDSPELLPLRKQLKESIAAAEAARVQKEKEKEKENEKEEAQKQLRIDELRKKASDFFTQGKYDDAQTVLNELLREEPQNAQASSLRTQISRAQTALKDSEAAIARKNYAEALNAIALLQKANPSDPIIPALRKQIDDSRASAHATLSVHRLAELATLFLDDQPIAAGELENKTVSIGSHRLSVKNAQGKQSVINLDLTEGLKVDLIYDASVPEIRYFTAADRALLEKRKLREETHTYQVEHNHGALRGKCKGVLTISGTSVSFKTTETDHSFSYRFEQLKLVRNKERFELSAQDNKKFTITLPDATKAEEANQIWEKLLRLAKE